MTWSIFDGTSEEWDSLIRSLGPSSPFSVSGWARFKSFGRWKSLRAIFTDGESTSSAVQVMWFKVFGIVTVAWAPGGPSGTLSFNAKDFLRFVKVTSQSSIAYLRMSSHAPVDEMNQKSLAHNGWRSPTSFIGARETFMISRTDGKLADPKRLSSNWSRNLQRGLKRSLPCAIWENPDVNELHLLHQQMTEFKKAKGPSRIPTAESLHHMIISMKNELLMVSARDNLGNLIAVRAAFIVGDSAWDAMAASNEVARKNYASYVCAWRLLEELESRGINHFDLAGVDFEENTGVFNFKKGLGGVRSTYLGEWDVASPLILQYVVRLFISRLA